MIPTQVKNAQQEASLASKNRILSGGSSWMTPVKSTQVQTTQEKPQFLSWADFKKKYFQEHGWADVVTPKRVRQQSALSGKVMEMDVTDPIEVQTLKQHEQEALKAYKSTYGAGQRVQQNIGEAVQWLMPATGKLITPAQEKISASDWLWDVAGVASALIPGSSVALKGVRTGAKLVSELAGAGAVGAKTAESWDEASTIGKIGGAAATIGLGALGAGTFGRVASGFESKLARGNEALAQAGAVGKNVGKKNPFNKGDFFFADDGNLYEVVEVEADNVTGKNAKGQIAKVKAESVTKANIAAQTPTPSSQVKQPVVETPTPKTTGFSPEVTEAVKSGRMNLEQFISEESLRGCTQELIDLHKNPVREMPWSQPSTREAYINRYVKALETYINKFAPEQKEALDEVKNLLKIGNKQDASIKADSLLNALHLNEINKMVQATGKPAPSMLEMGRKWQQLGGKLEMPMGAPVDASTLPKVEATAKAKIGQRLADEGLIIPPEQKPPTKGGTPPTVPPTVPPTAMAAGGDTGSVIDAFSEFIDNTEVIKRRTTLQKKLDSVERAIRVEAYHVENDRLIKNGIDPLTASQLAKSKLAGQLPDIDSAMAKKLTDDVIDEMAARIQAKVKEERNFNLGNTMDALIVFKERGRVPYSEAPNSHYQLLKKVFGKDKAIMDAIEGKSPLIEQSNKLVKKYKKLDLSEAPKTGATSGKGVEWIDQPIQEGIPTQTMFDEFASNMKLEEGKIIGGKSIDDVFNDIARELAQKKKVSQENLDRIRALVKDLEDNVPIPPEQRKFLMTVGDQFEFTAKNLNANAPEVSELFARQTLINKADSLISEYKRLLENYKGYQMRGLGSGGRQAEMELLANPELTTPNNIRRVFNVVASNFIDGLNVMRASLASGDISIYRQAAVAASRDPITAIKAFKPLVRSLLDGQYATQFDKAIRTSKGALGLERYGLELTALPTSKLAKTFEREESFMTRFAQYIPWVRWSNRAFVNGLNYIRVSRAEKMIAAWEKSGAKFSDSELKGLAQLINASTGRGNLGALNKYMPALNAVLFSPRFIASHIQLPMIALNPTTPRLVRIEAWKNIGAFLGGITGVLTLANLTGIGKVETDSRSPDYGKLRIGDTHIDLWGGYVQYIRFISQAMSQQKKTASGMILPISRKELGTRFAQGKLSPAIALFNDIWTGQTYSGEKMELTTESVSKQFYNRVMPMAIQDMIDGINQSGLAGLALGSLSTLGMGVTTYENRVKIAKDKVAKEQGYNSWDELGKALGTTMQAKLLDDTRIVAATKETEEKLAGAESNSLQRYYEEGKKIEASYKTDIEAAALKFRTTKNGSEFRELVNAAAERRRKSYAQRHDTEEYASISAFYDAPLTKEQMLQMNPKDIARHEYNDRMYGLTMYKADGSYDFDKAAQVEENFIKEFGQDAMDYIDDYRGFKAKDLPKEYQILKTAQKALEPYWAVEDSVLSLYPPDLKTVFDEIKILESSYNKEDQLIAKAIQRSYPQLLRARELIAQMRKQMKQRNPVIRTYYDMFYSY
jgi:hypothetical protein